MFTQCPECQIAFRVTARVLQQANGNVRCGNCSHAFNALLYLSEDAPSPHGPSTPEDAVDDVAETSRRLLETLDKLAGPGEFRIEDTGVEWRVLDEAAAEQEEAGLPSSRGGEFRYDDNTPLPDDAREDLTDAASAAPAPLRRGADSSEHAQQMDERQAGLALSDPEDWADILDEVGDADADAFAIDEELATIHAQSSAPRHSADEARPPDLWFSGRTATSAVEARAIDDALTDEVPHLDVEDGEDYGSDTHENEESFIERIEAETADDDESLDAAYRELDTGEFTADDIGLADDEEVGDEDTGAFVFDLSDDDEDLDATGEFEEFDAELQPAADSAAQSGVADNVVQEEDFFAAAGEDEDAAARSSGIGALDPEADADEDAPTGETEHYVPEPTEEELTVNMEIDQELFAAAGQEQDLTATMAGAGGAEKLFEQHPENVETIIMEGEFVRTAIEQERIAAEDAARTQLEDPAKSADTYSLRRDKLRGGRRRNDPPSFRMIAAAAGLALLLVAQLVHNTRGSLATSGLFNSTVAPLYRLFGNPVTPQWDVRGWQFETTNGNVAEGESALTVVSRITNRSAQPLPYPLVHIALTNRFEDIMGSRILEPGEYLAGEPDPSRPVPPGEKFTAVVKVANPSPDATGFKLNVCYRVQPGTIRCAIDSFKD